MNIITGTGLLEAQCFFFWHSIIMCGHSLRTVPYWTSLSITTGCSVSSSPPQGYTYFPPPLQKALCCWPCVMEHEANCTTFALFSDDQLMVTIDYCFNSIIYTCRNTISVHS